jgi:hypothetical protein
MKSKEVKNVDVVENTASTTDKVFVVEYPSDYRGKKYFVNGYKMDIDKDSVFSITMETAIMFEKRGVGKIK